jgi:biotin carboxyl carrier protein
MRWLVRIGEKEFLIERDANGGVRVNGEPIETSMHARGEGRFDLRFGDHIFDVDILRRDAEGRVDMLVNGKVAEAQVEDEKALLLKRFSLNQARRHHTAHIKAPMPGKIVKLLVQPGDEIAAGQGVVILEAMKMENEIKAPAAGTVKAVLVREQDAVEKNTVLIDIE